MTSNRVRSAAVLACSSVLAGTAGTFACPVPTPPLGSILCGPGGSGACAPGCAPDETVETTGGGGGSAPDSAGRGGQPFEISVVDFTFLPNTPIIKPNTVVRWNFNGLFPHTSTRTPTWDSGVLGQGQFFDFNFDATRAGLAYDYLCQLHFGMEGTINVAHFGDANLDGTVNLSDFNVLAANFGQSNRTWETGDFNEDGQVNLSDFNLLASSFGREIQPAPPGASLDIGSFVPEPAALGALTPVLALSVRRRRRP